eukprot:591688-Rhodomonas_salina.1
MEKARVVNTEWGSEGVRASGSARKAAGTDGSSLTWMASVVSVRMMPSCSATCTRTAAAQHAKNVRGHDGNHSR